jgi:hypothetical protein
MAGKTTPESPFEVKKAFLKQCERRNLPSELHVAYDRAAIIMGRSERNSQLLQPLGTQTGPDASKLEI